MELNIGVIRLDGGTQPRAEINEEVVGEYMEAMLDGANFPAITVFHDGSAYWLADGFHRYHANKRAGFLTIDCDVKSGTKRDAIFFSLGANDKHGLRRTHEDKRRAIMLVLEDIEWGELTDREIARICNVSHPTVGRVKKSLEMESKPAPKKEPKIKEEKIEPPAEDYRVAELAAEHLALVEENQKLQDRLASEVMDASEDEKNQALTTMQELRATIKQLEVENAALKVSRNEFQLKATELMKQVEYWKRRATKAEKA